MSQARRSPERWTAQVASGWLGGGVLALATLETLWQEGLDPVLPHAAMLMAGHWTIGSVLLLGAFAGRATARVLLLVIGMVLLAAGLAGLIAAGAAGEALGLARAVPVPAAVLNLALGAAIAAASLLPARA